MECEALRDRLVAYAAGRLSTDGRAEVRIHLEACAACRRAAEAEGELTAALDRLPRAAAPGALRRRLEDLVATGSEEAGGGRDGAAEAPDEPRRGSGGPGFSGHHRAVTSRRPASI